MTRTCCVACDRNTRCDILIGLYQVQRFVGAYVRPLWQLTNSFSISKQHRKLTICAVQFGNSYWTKYIRAVSANSYRQHLLSVTGYCNSVYCNEILHTISVYWQHKSLFDVNGTGTEWDISFMLTCFLESYNISQETVLDDGRNTQSILNKITQNRLWKANFVF